MNTPRIALTIKLIAATGKEAELSDLLTAAADIVKKTEPQTLYWFATRLDERTFTINDGFSDESGMQAHFAGQVAGLLKSKSTELVEGGWDHGVLPNVVRSDILSTIQ